MSTTPPADRTSPAPPSATPSATPSARLDLGVAQVAASALAAVTSALAASTLGVAGTIAGAGVGAVVATVGSAVYAHSLRRASERVRQLRAMEMRPASGLRWPLTRPGAGADAPGPTEPRTASPTHPLALPVTTSEPLPADSDDAEGWPWRRAAVMIAGGFVLALAGITAAEAVLGHPVSSSKESGTSIQRAVTGSGGSDRRTPSGPATSTPTTGTDSPTSDVTSPTSVPTSSPAERTSSSTSVTSSTTAPSATAPATSPTASLQGSATSPAATSQAPEAPAPRATSAPAGDGSP